MSRIAEFKTKDSVGALLPHAPDISKDVTHGDIVRLAEDSARLYARTYGVELRKQRGQFCTPRPVASYMAGLFDLRGGAIRLLDAGAGTGILTAAFCHRILCSDKRVELAVDAYENDKMIIPLLRKTLNACKVAIEAKGHSLNYTVNDNDFVVSNGDYLRAPNLFGDLNPTVYDYAISNPPYYKLTKGWAGSKAMPPLACGQPNIYALFMAVAASMLKPDGELVFITPRSFCSGLYYESFREWLLGHADVSSIHLFESRTDVFDNDGVLQESVILKASRRRHRAEQVVTVTASESKSFERLVRLEVRTSDIIHGVNGQTFIRIPTSRNDLDIMHIVDKWPCTLKSLGLEISTGPVVPFRAKDNLVGELTDGGKAVPLLWMHNLRDFSVFWPLRKGGKASAIRVRGETMPLLVPSKNYVLVKRFSSKEQVRRLQAVVLLESQFPYPSVGIENHVNYIYRPGGNLSEYESFGIAAVLNTGIVDRYFRTTNGSTQVNATEMRSLPLPNMEQIIRIGGAVYRASDRSNLAMDELVRGVLDLQLKIA